MKNRDNNDYTELKNTLNDLAIKWDISGYINLTYQDETIISRSYGYADRENNVKNTDESTYALKYTCRLFCSMAVMSLAQKGTLKLNDYLSEYIPEYSHSGEIRIRHLLYNESGIPDFIRSKLLVISESANRECNEREVLANEKKLISKHYTFKEMLEAINKDELLFTPGKRTADTESAWLMLAEVYKRISGESLRDYIQREIIDVLKLKNTVFGLSANTVSYDVIHETQLFRVTGYEENDGVITTTAHDFCRIANALCDGTLIKKKTLKKMLKYNFDGLGIGFDDNSGVACTTLAYLGNRAIICFDEEMKICFTQLLNENLIYKYEQGRDLTFYLQAFRQIESEFVYPVNPKLVKCDERNFEAAINLEVLPFQLEYVCDARTSLSIAYAVKTAEAFILMDRGHSIGMCVLNADRKKGEYHIIIILIDIRFQHRGYGGVMVRQAVKYLKRKGAKNLEIEVARSNEVAKRLYESVGFKVVHVGDDECYLRMKVD